MNIRNELTQLGLEELKTPTEVEDFISKNNSEVVLIYINSTCGCAMSTAKPALKMALTNSKLPKLATVFAGQDTQATAKAREYFAPYPPSSPSFYILKNGVTVFAIERHQILHQDSEDVKKLLTDAFDKYC